jgi:hypothetical protein
MTRTVWSSSSVIQVVAHSHNLLVVLALLCASLLLLCWRLAIAALSRRISQRLVRLRLHCGLNGAYMRLPMSTSPTQTASPQSCSEKTPSDMGEAWC